MDNKIKDQKLSWLDRVRINSWESEILIVGFVLIILLQTIDYFEVLINNQHNLNSFWGGMPSIVNSILMPFIIYVLFVSNYVLIISLSIDGLYGIGHFLAYGIGLITAFILLFSMKGTTKSLRIFLISSISIFVIWHGLIKYSIWQGYKSYDNEQYTKSIANLKRAVYLYPKKIGKMHMRLAEMYLIQNDSKKALEHALIAQDMPCFFYLEYFPGL